MNLKKISTLIFLSFFLLTILNGQVASVTISGNVQNKGDQSPLPFVNLVLKTKADSSFVTGTVSDVDGRFTLSEVNPASYLLELSYVGFHSDFKSLFVGSLSKFLDMGALELEANTTSLGEVLVLAKQDDVNADMDKKTYALEDNISQGGGSVLQSLQNLPGITVQDNKVQLRGNEKITILIDGKQTALTGFDGQAGLDNIPASAIEKIEIINNPSSKYNANGSAGIINIIMKKNKQEGFNGKVGLSAGIGALWVRQENLPAIRPQYKQTPKINPSISLNYRRKKINAFFQADNLYTQTLNKNEFVTRTYDDGTIINQQLKRNRNTNFFTSKVGMDWSINEANSLTVSALFGSEKIIDRGDQPFFNQDLSERLRLWQFLEDELKTTAMATMSYQHKFKEPGHILNAGFNYTFHRENEQYFYDNYLSNSSGTDAFKLLSVEQVFDFNVDYIKPLKHGSIETGMKLRNRIIPTDMNFIPGTNSVLDTSAGGWATYREIIPAIYGNYVYENSKIEAELGMRLEYVKINYEVNANHSTYKSSGYNYTQAFPNLRFAYKINEKNKLSIFYNRRVDRPNEVDIRIFPKYDDAEIIKVGNPALSPQFTNSVELGYKSNWDKGYIYSALYTRFSEATITRISSIVPGSNLIYAIYQNAGKSINTGLELVLSQELTPWYTANLNGNVYYNQIDAFSVENLYPSPNTFSAAKQNIVSGNVKLNNNFHFPQNFDVQISAIYLAPDIIPQGKIDQRLSFDLGLKKKIQKEKGELIFNANDLFNTMVIKKEIQGNGFSYKSKDYYETQVLRLSYSYKF